MDTYVGWTVHGGGAFSGKDATNGIIDHLKLRQPIFRKTAAYGHFGCKEFTWESLDATEELLAKAKHV